MSEIKLNRTEQNKTKHNTAKTARPAGNQLNKLPNPAKLSEKLLCDSRIRWNRAENPLTKTKKKSGKCERYFLFDVLMRKRKR